jgi:hypothetical protein
VIPSSDQTDEVFGIHRGLGKYIAVPFPSHGDQEEGRQHVGRSFHDEGRRAERAAAEV